VSLSDSQCESKSVLHNTQSKEFKDLKNDKNV